QVTILEMKELNERQRADHATRMYNKLKSSLQDLENRNLELDQKFNELTRMNMEGQKTERDLRDELSEVVPKSVSDADRRKMALLEEDLVKTKLKMSKLQDIAEISRNQLMSVQSQQQARERELKSLRQQLNDFQQQTDEHALIGQLHHQVLTLQASEAEAERKLNISKQNITKFKAQVFRAEKLNEKDDTIYLTRTECNNKIRNLRRTIQSLRQQFSGALPLAQQEKFATSMMRLREDKRMMQEEIQKMRIDRGRLEDQLMEVEVKSKGLDDLRRAIEDKRGTEQITEWCRKMDTIRLQDMKLQRQVTRQNEQIAYQERLNNQHEVTISGLEEDIVQMLKVQEDHQVEWESREAELERLLDQFQSQQREINKRAKKLEDFSEILPPTTLPLDAQLSKALQTIKVQRQTMTNLQAQIKNLELESDRLKDVRHTLESDVTSRDRIINQLRLHMPTSAVVSQPIVQQLKIATNTIETLKKRLAAKEDSLERYKELLDESRRDHEMMAAAHERDMLTMQNKIHVKTDDAFTKFKQAATSAIQPQGKPPTPAELQHLNELEEMVREQDAAMSALMERVRSSNREISGHKRALMDARKQHDAEKNKIHEDHETLLNVIRTKLAKKHRKVEELTKELEVTSAELTRQKESNSRAPATSMKNLVARLKEELQEKEKQQQQLSHALKELRQDLVQQAQENIRAASATERDAHNVTTLVEKKTSHYKDEIEDLKDQIAQFRRNLKKSEKTESTLKSELHKALEDGEKRLQVIQRWQKNSKNICSQKQKKLKKYLFPKTKKLKKYLFPKTKKLKKYLFSKAKKLKKYLFPKNKKNSKNICSQKQKNSKNILAKWDAKKQWQNKVETLKTKLQEKENAIVALEKQISTLRASNTRLEREKLRKPLGPPIHSNSTEHAVTPSDQVVRKHLHTIEDLSRCLCDVIIFDLRKMTTLPHNQVITEMKVKNEKLSEQLEAMQKEILIAEKDESMTSQLQERENRLQGRVLQLASENTEMQFEIEQIKLDVPRLKERVDYQQRFIDLLKSEKRELEQRIERIKLQKKVRYGKTIPELEKTVVLMKKVVERVQRENDQLKKAPGVVSNQLLEQLKLENQILKNRIDEMTQQIGGQLSMRYESKTQSVEKLVRENEKLRKDLDRQATTRDKIRDAKQNLQVQHNKLLKEFEEIKKKLLLAESKAPKLNGTGSKGYNSAITARMLESKLRKTESELEKKTKEVAGLKGVLEDQRDKEDQLSPFNNQSIQSRNFTHQVEILERFPSGAGGSDANTVRELQLTRLTVARLENEKEELSHMIKLTNQKLGDEKGPEENSVKAENVRINTEMLVLRKENSHLANEVARMREELSHFDGEFFDEIEDLKFNYSESVKKNVAYEEQLRALSQQFGIAIQLP
uniref:Centrosomal protein of 290kDa coiled-coil region domain-containing protein n=1 Tax=Ciona savignyi TaxID=51511 RepID=H2YZT9_CIOSA